MPRQVAHGIDEIPAKFPALREFVPDRLVVERLACAPGAAIKAARQIAGPVSIAALLRRKHVRHTTRSRAECQPRLGGMNRFHGSATCSKVQPI
jgi:hypothetical protein